MGTDGDNVLGSTVGAILPSRVCAQVIIAERVGTDNSISQERIVNPFFSSFIRDTFIFMKHFIWFPRKLFSSGKIFSNLYFSLIVLELYYQMSNTYLWLKIELFFFFFYCENSILNNFLWKKLKIFPFYKIIQLCESNFIDISVAYLSIKNIIFINSKHSLKNWDPT